ncbi:MAG: TetR/AcrR family transcriptional regulator [Bacteroidales bacterium]|nr:TetR/AcrR family transcriptional regulator [Bacteroidales bacterium]MDD3988878.1 TetR/AcrR family transcriptional regulator [Bacteroidales bacterium]MDD4638427.1 TetR/AcrR family transcriptional regulator [Bacteroidales bacterium]
MSRVSSRDKYIAQLLRLFKKRGLQLTMDVIAKELNITKKTLYNNFISKDVLMRAVMKHVLEDIEFRINIALSQGKNAIEALYQTSNMMNKALEDIGPVLLHDTATCLPDLHLLDHTNRMSFYSRIIKENLERGITESLYRNDINKELVTLFFTSSMAKIYSWNGSYKFLMNPYVFHSELVRYHLEAIVNDEGRKILRQFLKK